MNKHETLFEENVNFFEELHFIEYTRLRYGGESYHHSMELLSGSEAMIFLVVGCVLLAIGILFSVFPSRGGNPLYGYNTYRSRKSDEVWRYAQKVSGRYFMLYGGLSALIGMALKLSGHTNFFIIEMLLITLPIVAVFASTEEKLQKFNHDRGDDDEHIDD